MLIFLNKYIHSGNGVSHNSLVHGKWGQPQFPCFTSTADGKWGQPQFPCFTSTAEKLYGG
jgi:uncharacterized membrane protein